MMDAPEGVPRLSTARPELPEAGEGGASLGVGSFGSVWRVTHRETLEEGAVKVRAQSSARSRPSPTLRADTSRSQVLPRPEENTHKLMRITTEIATMERSCRGCPFIPQLREARAPRGEAG